MSQATHQAASQQSGEIQLQLTLETYMRTGGA